MTMPAPNTAPRIIDLPAPRFPLLTRVISHPLADDKEPSVIWGLGEEHPLVSGAKIIRMFLHEDGVAIYSTDGKIGMRNFLLMNRVRFTEETMPLHVFAEEIDIAGDDDDDDDDDDEPEIPEQPESNDSGLASS